MKKNLIIPIVVLGLMTAFLLVCLFVIVSKGKGSWIRRKLRLGGLILSLSAASVSCAYPEECYTGVYPSLYPCSLTNSQNILYTNSMIMDLSLTNILYCKIQYAYPSSNYYYSFNIMDGNTLIASNTMDLITFPDPALEPRHAVVVDPVIPDGQYKLNFVMHDTNGNSWPEYWWDLSLTITR